MAGTRDIVDEKDPWASLERRGGGLLAVFSKADGSKVAEHKLVIFAKGSKDRPMCGFSHRAITIASQLGNRALVMIGAKNLLDTGSGLRFTRSTPFAMLGPSFSRAYPSAARAALALDAAAT